MRRDQAPVISARSPEPVADVTAGFLRRLRDRPERRALGEALAYFLVTRLALSIVAAAAVRFLPVGVQAGTEAYLGRSLSLGAWLRWDAWWFLSVVERGYSFDLQGKSNVAFFPLLPLMIKALTRITGNPVVAGFVVANVATLVGVVALWWWVRVEAGQAAADRAVRWLAVYPFSFFLHTIYSEPLFFCLVTLSFLAVRRERWLAAGLWGGLAAATRPLGVLLLPAVAAQTWHVRRTGRDPGWAGLLGLGLIAAGPGIYMLYLGLTFGDPFAFWKAHARGWGIGTTWDFSPYWKGLRLLLPLPRIESYHQLLSVLSLVLPLVFGVLVIVAFRRLGLAAGAYSAAVVCVAVLLAPESIGRELLAVIPAFAAVGYLGAPAGGEGLRLLSFALLLVLLFAFVTGHFVG